VEFSSLAPAHRLLLVEELVLDLQAGMVKDHQEASRGLPMHNSLELCSRQQDSSHLALTILRAWPTSPLSSPRASNYPPLACRLPRPQLLHSLGSLVLWSLVLDHRVECSRPRQRHQVTVEGHHRPSQPWRNSHLTALPNHRLDHHLQDLHCSQECPPIRLSRCGLAT